MEIVNAIVPVAGLGTRLLPCTKSQPKEMLPVGRKPVVQFVFEELERSGIRRVLFVTGRGKHAIEDHFDRDVELRRILEADPSKQSLLETLAFENHNVQIFYVRQSQQLGLGHAVLHGRGFAEGRPFVVALGDSIIMTPDDTSQIVRRLVACYRERGASAVIAFEEVPRAEVSHYGIAAPAESPAPDVFEVRDLVEKPSPKDAPSNLAVAGRYVLCPETFDVLEKTKPGKNQEIQLTDAIRTLARTKGGVYGVRLMPGEKRYDIGNMASYFRSFVDFALRDPEYGPGLREYLRTALA